MKESTGTKLKRILLHPFVILFLLLIIMTAMTWVLPASQYDAVTVNGVNTIDPASYHYVDNTPVSIFSMFKAIPQGVQTTISLICMMLTIGAAVHMVDETGAIRSALMALTHKTGEKNTKFVLAGAMIFFMFIGAFPSMFEACIPFMPIVVPVCLLLGYDVVTAVCIVVIGDIIGWTAGPTNLYTVGNSQNIGGLPMFSGIGYRLIVLVVLGAVALWYVIRYAERVKKDPSKSLVAGQDYSDLRGNVEDMEFTVTRKLILGVFIATVILVVYGSLNWGWGTLDMAATYLICAMICAIIARYTPDKAADVMLDGASSMFVAAMVIGIARGLSVIMDAGQITYTIVHALASMLSGMPPAVTAVGMMAVVVVLNFFMPSGSSKALILMPILMPMAEIIGLSKQITILAYQFGDGISNLAFPTVALLVACLSYTRVSFDKWFKFILPFEGIVYAVCVVLLVIASAMGY